MMISPAFSFSPTLLGGVGYRIIGGCGVGFRACPNGWCGVGTIFKISIVFSILYGRIISVRGIHTEN